MIKSGHQIDRPREPRDRDEAGTGHSSWMLLSVGALPTSLSPPGFPPSLTLAFLPALF